MPNFKRITIVCGHYGCGKTNLSINLAIDCAKAGNTVTLVDLDLVNPYFRSSEYGDILQKNQVKLIAPVYANTTLDLPMLPAELNSIFTNSDDHIILDVGGDDVGSTVLGTISGKIREAEYDMLYVVNRYRALTTTAEEAVELLKEIEAASRLKATAVVNNSHLKNLTTAQDILNSAEFAQNAAEMLNLPLLFTTAPKQIGSQQIQTLSKIPNLYPIEIYVRSPWEIDVTQ
jgi:cellulose biosynthesis protein BcsQ